MKICLWCDKTYDGRPKVCPDCKHKLEGYSKITAITLFIDENQFWMLSMLHKSGIIKEDFKKNPKKRRKQQRMLLELFIFTMALLYNVLRVDCNQQSIESNIYEVMKMFLSGYDNPGDIDKLWDERSEEYINCIELDERNMQAHVGLLTVHTLAKNMAALDEKGRIAPAGGDNSDPVSLFLGAMLKSSSESSINKLELWQKLVKTYWEMIRTFCLSICENTTNFTQLSDAEFERRRQQAKVKIEEHKYILH